MSYLGPNDRLPLTPAKGRDRLERLRADAAARELLKEHERDDAPRPRSPLKRLLARVRARNA